MKYDAEFDIELGLSKGELSNSLDRPLRRRMSRALFLDLSYRTDLMTLREFGNAQVRSLHDRKES